MNNFENKSEQAFLGSVLFDNDIIKTTTLQEDDFLDTDSKTLFRAYKAMDKSGFDVTPTTVYRFLQTHDLDFSLLSKAEQACEHSMYYQSYEKQIKENSNDYRIKKIKSEMTPENMNESIRELKAINATEKKGSNIIDLADSFEKFRDEFTSRGGLGYKSCFPMIDKYVGGVIPGKVYCIVAYSGVGKSNFSYCYMVDALKKGKKVLVFSLEVQKEMLFNSLLKSYYNINQSQILDPNFSFDLQHFKNLTIYDDIYSLSSIESTIQNTGADVVFIDFIQNVQTEGNSEYEKMTKAAQNLQMLAIQTNATIFNISQANNDSRFKDSSKIQPKGSGAIFASSDIIFSLSRNGELLQLNLLKNKYGPSDKNFVVQPNFRNLQFNISRELQTTEVQEEKTDFN